MVNLLLIPLSFFPLHISPFFCAVDIKGLSKNYNVHKEEMGAGPEEDQIWHLPLYSKLTMLKRSAEPWVTI